MKKLTVLGALCASAAFAAVPVIDPASVTVEQRGNRTVVISYDLNAAAEGDAEPAIVTVDILTNAVGEAAASVGGEHLWTLSGDVNRIVPQGSRKILWQPHKEGMGEWTLPALQVQAVVTAWATNAPPLYWLIDLSTTASAKDRTYDRYYPNAEQIPNTVTNPVYKTEWLVFRHIPSCGVTWRQGTSTDDYSEAKAYETPRYVTFSYDYYMAVFELTRGQYARLSRKFTSKIGFGSSGPTDEDFASARPMTGNPVQYQPNGLDNATKFDPAGGRIRTLNVELHRDSTALSLNVDCPTLAEYEYACRAGTENLYVSGDGDFGDYAWYSGNRTGTDSFAFHEVGLKLPNAWGLYDIQGNVQEFALDWSCMNSSRTVDPVWDPLGPAKTENYRSMYGGWFGSSKANCRASCPSRMPPAQPMGNHASDGKYNTGFRFVIIMP